MKVFEQVKQMILQELKVDASKITLEARLQEDLGMDSLDAVELVMNVESEYGIIISDEQAMQIKTIGDVVAFVEGMKE